MQLNILNTNVFESNIGIKIVPTMLLDKPFSTYFGGKEATGVPSAIISNIPSCKVVVEACGGNYAISRNIDNEEVNYIINEIDVNTFAQYAKAKHFYKPNYKFTRSSYENALYTAAILSKTQKVFVLIDPPYHPQCRLSKYDNYDHDFTVMGHQLLVDRVKSYANLPNLFIMITHKQCHFYGEAFKDNLDWSYIPFESSDREHKHIPEWMIVNYQKSELDCVSLGYVLGGKATSRSASMKKIRRNLRIWKEAEYQTVLPYFDYEMRPYFENKYGYQSLIAGEKKIKISSVSKDALNATELKKMRSHLRKWLLKYSAKEATVFYNLLIKQRKNELL